MDDRWDPGPFGTADAVGLLGWLTDLGPVRGAVLLSRTVRLVAGADPGEQLEFWTVAEAVAGAVLVSAKAGGPGPGHPVAVAWCAGPAGRLAPGQVRDLVPHARRALVRALDPDRNAWAAYWRDAGLLGRAGRDAGPWREHLGRAGVG